jgi:hypothetical protein
MLGTGVEKVMDDFGVHIVMYLVAWLFWFVFSFLFTSLFLQRRLKKHFAGSNDLCWRSPCR